MVAPVRHRAGVPFAANTNQALLDKMYNLFLGPGGDRWLSTEVKWLAVTHKSFDHGRRGFNDRMAFLGKRIVQLHATLAIINSPASSIQETPVATLNDAAERTPFIHPATAGLEKLSTTKIDEILDKGRLAQLANQYGLTAVIRWKPKKANNLVGSGIESVAIESLYAIVGAVALSKGGSVAATVVRERILQPLGLVVG
ncbi:hypothetical protein GP486_000726 [Trichoglossum hirsutum]|uniref:RNase III domain-containing protein n=1 Tax=Trichoglossum hirsutum TaxID=265104 RepID=A0A9P8LIH3_9PEZI|nr:hypothetical protein GP486_000726 [Trichoglossum hirsutum]